MIILTVSSRSRLLMALRISSRGRQTPQALKIDALFVQAHISYHSMRVDVRRKCVVSCIAHRAWHELIARDFQGCVCLKTNQCRVMYESLMPSQVIRYEKVFISRGIMQFLVSELLVPGAGVEYLRESLHHSSSDH